MEPLQAVGARHWRGIAMVAIAVLAIGCYAPALHAYFVLDDFTLLAESRLLRQPLGAFVHDHFPGSLFFRPLGIVVWWLTTAGFDNAPRGHYAVNLLLHLAVVGALYALLQRLRRSALNLGWAAIFAVHPLAIGTALWLSDRFDLIATLFTLLALNAGLRYRAAPRPATLAVALGCVLLAFAGKEIAVVGAAALGVLLIVPDAGSRLALRQRFVAAGTVAFVSAAWLAWRHLLMTNPQDVLLLPGEIVATFARGIGLWLRIGFEFLALDPRLSPALRLAIALAMLPLALAIVRAVRERDWRASRWGVGAALLVLIFLPGPTQAPVVAFSTADLDAHTFWFNLIGESRLYHLSLAGLVCALMLLTTPAQAPATGSTRVDRLVLAGLLPLLALWTFAAHGIARDFARRTRAQVAPLQAAHAAIAALPLGERRCQIYLLGTNELWGFDGLADPLIKGSAPAALGRRLERCLIMTDRTAWGSFVRAGAIGPEDWRPLRPLRYRGVPVPWLVLDGFEAAYLDLDADIDARTIDGAFFLEYRDGRFVDVGAAVRDGSRPVRFRNVRPDRG